MRERANIAQSSQSMFNATIMCIVKMEAECKREDFMVLAKHNVDRNQFADKICRQFLRTLALCSLTA